LWQTNGWFTKGRLLPKQPKTLGCNENGSIKIAASTVPIRMSTGCHFHYMVVGLYNCQKLSHFDVLAQQKQTKQAGHPPTREYSHRGIQAPGSFFTKTETTFHCVP
jgi:hypothetical protein